PTTSTFKITVQRDTDHDGDPDITDTDDDGDGYTDVDEVAHGTDPKDPTSVPTTTPQTTITNPNQTVIDEQPITNIVITPGDPATVITVDTSKLPNGVTYNPTTHTISGTPDVTNWTPTEETRTFEIPVTVQNPDGTTANKKIKITVQRDTDGDGTPDVTDTDDDGDGIPDTVEQAAGSDPKDANSRPAAVITPVAQPTINNPIQTVIDGNPITNIVITPGDPASVVTVDTPSLPNGVTYDPSTNTISGTPNITDWGTTEETRNFQVTVTVQNPDGTTVTRTIDITVERDTDGDGDPDVTDLDDDNDGYTDVEEVANGTDPKDANSRPASAPQPSSPSTPSASGSSSTVQRTAQTSDATNLFGYATSMTFFATLLLILAFIRKEQSAK
ncbi:putative Ig domain-containing protein, partial [uncultured Solobacterium sp.]|uniref:putative Ig domain-containing protein n=1 Tax=uncultured Solobacterium sp. TaxID=747375 RepID=UPI0028D2F7C3